MSLRIMIPTLCRCEQNCCDCSNCYAICTGDYSCIIHTTHINAISTLMSSMRVEIALMWTQRLCDFVCAEPAFFRAHYDWRTIIVDILTELLSGSIPDAHAIYFQRMMAFVQGLV